MALTFQPPIRIIFPRLYAYGAELGHMKVSMDTAFEAPDPAFWAPNGYVVIIADRRGGFKSEGKLPSGVQEGDDLFHVIEWAAAREWSNGNVGMTGVSALCRTSIMRPAGSQRRLISGRSLPGRADQTLQGFRLLGWSS